MLGPESATCDLVVPPGRGNLLRVALEFSSLGLSSDLVNGTQSSWGGQLH